MKAFIKSPAVALIIGGLLLSVFFLLTPHAPVRAQKDSPATLLETGGASKLVKTKDAPAALKIVSYNIRYRGGKDLQELIKLLRDDADIGGGAIIGLRRGGL